MLVVMEALICPTSFHLDHLSLCWPKLDRIASSWLGGPHMASRLRCTSMVQGSLQSARIGVSYHFIESILHLS